MHGRYREGDRWCRSCSAGPMDGKGVESPEETQEHLEQCVAYANIRVGRNVEEDFKDKVEYFRELETLRSAREWE